MNAPLESLPDRLGRLCSSAAAGAADSPTTEADPQRQPPCQVADYAAKGYHLDVTVAPGQVVAAAKLLDEYGFALDTLTGVDWLAEGQMEVVYDYFHPHASTRDRKSVV